MNSLKLTVLAALSAALASLAFATDGAFALAVLNSDASVEAKARACQDLAVIGEPRAVPVLADLLNHPALASYARSALEVIDDPAASKALRDALSSLDGEQLIGAVTSLGVKKDSEAISALSDIAANENNPAAEAALVALAQIGTKKAVDAIIGALKSAASASHRTSAAHAALMAAEATEKSGKSGLSQRLLKAVKAADVPEHIQKAATS